MIINMYALCDSHFAINRLSLKQILFWSVTLQKLRLQNSWTFTDLKQSVVKYIVFNNLNYKYIYQWLLLDIIYKYIVFTKYNDCLTVTLYR